MTFDYVFDPRFQIALEKAISNANTAALSSINIRSTEFDCKLEGCGRQFGSANQLSAHRWGAHGLKGPVIEKRPKTAEELEVARRKASARRALLRAKAKEESATKLEIPKYIIPQEPPKEIKVIPTKWVPSGLDKTVDHQKVRARAYEEGISRF